MLIDTTLREGAQLFGAYFSNEKKHTILAGLVGVDIEEVEAGWIGQENLDLFVNNIRSECTHTHISVWSPCRSKDIRAASSLGVDRVNIGIPVSDSHMQKRLGIERKGLLAHLRTTLHTANRCNIRYISLGLEDVSRADKKFALEVAEIAQDMGVSRIRLSDSVGVLTPETTAELVKLFKKNLNCDLAVHCHNDFGMATANAVTAINNGADYADSSLLGIGERSGISATEEVAAYLTLHRKSHHYNLKNIKHLCTFVSQAADVKFPRTKPVVGNDIFSCESGIHAHAMTKSPDIFEPYNPKAVNSTRRTAIGGKSGRASVIAALNAFNIDFQAENIPALVNSIRKLSLQLERPLTQDELATLTKKTTATAQANNA